MKIYKNQINYNQKKLINFSRKYTNNSRNYYPFRDK